VSGVVISGQQHFILGSSGVPAAVTGTVSETILATVAIPGGLIGANGFIRVSSLWTYTNSANSKTVGWRFGAAGAGTGGTSYMATPVTTSSLFVDNRFVRNVNSISSQKGASNGNPTGGIGVSSGSPVTSSVNTGAACEIVFTGTLTNTGETITLQSYLVELLRM
jgi:hypothetical protein